MAPRVIPTIREITTAAIASFRGKVPLAIGLDNFPDSFERLVRRLLSPRSTGRDHDISRFQYSKEI